MDDPGFRLRMLEQHGYRREYEAAARELIKLLAALEAGYGRLSDQAWRTAAPGEEGDYARLATRVCAVIGAMFADPDFVLTPGGLVQLGRHRRWIAALFAATPLRNADHVLRALSRSTDDRALELDPASLPKLGLLYGPESDIALSLPALWEHDRGLAVGVGFGVLSARFVGSDAASAKRDAVLQQLPVLLRQLDGFEGEPPSNLHDAYLNGSYADVPGRHEVKREINRLLRAKLVDMGLGDLDAAAPCARVGGKPVLLALLEGFTGGHSIFRVLSSSLAGLKTRFHVVGMAPPAAVDAQGRATLDDFIPLTGDLSANIAAVRAEAERRPPAVAYFPSIGMDMLNICLSTIRLAPLQVTAIGHAATTLSTCVDVFAVGSDLLEDRSGFSERLLELPPGAMPHVRSAQAAPSAPVLRPAPERVEAAVVASVMKLNPRMLGVFRTIVETARTPVRFNLFLSLAEGLLYEPVLSLIRRFLPDAQVHVSQPYADYAAALGRTDLYLSPFPFGGMNGIADMAAQGLVGVCRTGPELQQSMDAGLFRRLGLPEWLIARTDEDYVAAAVRLIDNPEERLALGRALIARGGDAALLRGRPAVLGDRLLELCRELRPELRDETYWNEG